MSPGEVLFLPCYWFHQFDAPLGWCARKRALTNTACPRAVTLLAETRVEHLSSFSNSHSAPIVAPCDFISVHQWSESPLKYWSIPRFQKFPEVHATIGAIHIDDFVMKEMYARAPLCITLTLPTYSAELCMVGEE